MSEAAFRKEVKGAFQNTGAHLSWIESHATAAGFPDLELCHCGVSQQIELKFAKEDGEIHIRKSQYLWFRQRVKAGGAPLLWVKSFDGLHYLVPGVFVYDPKPITCVDQLKFGPSARFESVIHVVDAILRINREAIINNSTRRVYERT